jgi:hypothetical protein
VTVNYDGFTSDVALHDVVLVDGGIMSLKVRGCMGLCYTLYFF